MSNSVHESAVVRSGFEIGPVDHETLSRFGLIQSASDGSLDVARYIEMAAQYDKTQKAYLPTRSFRPTIASPQPAAFLDLLLAPESASGKFRRMGAAPGAAEALCLASEPARGLCNRRLKIAELSRGE